MGNVIAFRRPPSDPSKSIPGNGSAEILGRESIEALREMQADLEQVRNYLLSIQLDLDTERAKIADGLTRF